jgi:hypothetical protein
MYMLKEEYVASQETLIINIISEILSQMKHQRVLAPQVLEISFSTKSS